MKKMFILLLAFITMQASSQVTYYDFKKFKENRDSSIYMPLDNGKQTEIISKDSLENLLKKFEQKQYMPNIGKLVFSQPNGTNVYALPADNMPCLVPDLSLYNYNMPVAGMGIKISGMPPGSVPNSMIPRNNNRKPLP